MTWVKCGDALRTALIHLPKLERAREQDDAKPAKKVKTETGAATPAASTPGGGSSTIFIKNMPWSATEDTVRSFFEAAGEVTDIRIGAPTL